MIGGLFVGGADGFAPGIGVVGVDVFVLGEGQDLDEGLAGIQRRKADSWLCSGFAKSGPPRRAALQDTRGARAHHAGRSEDRRYDGESGSFAALGMTRGGGGRRQT